MSPGRVIGTAVLVSVLGLECYSRRCPRWTIACEVAGCSSLSVKMQTCGVYLLCSRPRPQPSLSYPRVAGVFPLPSRLRVAFAIASHPSPCPRVPSLRWCDCHIIVAVVVANPSCAPLLTLVLHPPCSRVLAHDATTMMTMTRRSPHHCRPSRLVLTAESSRFRHQSRTLCCSHGRADSDVVRQLQRAVTSRSLRSHPRAYAPTSTAVRPRQGRTPNALGARSCSCSGSRGGHPSALECGITCGWCLHQPSNESREW